MCHHVDRRSSSRCPGSSLCFEFAYTLSSLRLLLSTRPAHVSGQEFHLLLKRPCVPTFRLGLIHCYYFQQFRCLKLTRFCSCSVACCARFIHFEKDFSSGFALFGSVIHDGTQTPSFSRSRSVFVRLEECSQITSNSPMSVRSFRSLPPSFGAKKSILRCHEETRPSRTYPVQ